MRASGAAVTAALLLDFGAIPTWVLAIVGIGLFAAGIAMAAGIATDLVTR